jgi:diphthamide biosynthesis enzyme Dph1/Dph2-like protein
MKLLFIETKKKQNKDEMPSFAGLNSLPKELFLAYSIQYKSLAELIRTELESKKYKISGFQQVLGCSKLKLKQGLAILLVGTGRFHALNLALQNTGRVFVFDEGNISEIKQEEIDLLKKQKRVQLNKFVLANKLGILISTKPGQENSKKAEQLKERITKKYPKKSVYFFVSNNINVNEFENFDIDFWINSACPGLTNDTQKIANIDDILDFL